MDYAVDFPETSNGNRHLLIMVEAFSKMIIAVPTPDRTSATTAQAFLQHVLCKYGAPAVVTTDNGVEFHGDLEGLLADAMIDHRYTARAHPQANGQAERAVQTMKSLLRRMVADKSMKKDWDVHVHWAALGYHFSMQQNFPRTKYCMGQERFLPKRQALNPQRLDPGSSFWSRVQSLV